MRKDTSEIAIRIIHNSSWRLLALFFTGVVLRYYTWYVIIQFIQISQIRIQARNSIAPLHGINLKFAWEIWEIKSK